MSPEELASSWRNGALVFVGERGSAIVRPAAFVFVDDRGLSWVEPAYADPFGAASPAFHRREGQALVLGDRIELHGGPELVELVPFLPEIHEDDDGGALVWFAEHLVTIGTEWHAERTRVWKLIS